MKVSVDISVFSFQFSYFMFHLTSTSEIRSGCIQKASKSWPRGTEDQIDIVKLSE